LDQEIIIKSEFESALLILSALLRTVPSAQYQYAAIKAITKYLRFDSSLWVEVWPAGRHMFQHSCMLYNQPEEIINNYCSLPAEKDFLASAALQSAGYTIDIDSIMPREKIKQQPIFTDHMHPYSISHCLCTAIPSDQASIFSFIYFFRSEDGDYFNEQERQFSESITPFLADGYNNTQYVSFPQQLNAADPISGAMAIVDEYGVVYQQTPSWSGAIQKLNLRNDGSTIPLEWNKYLLGNDVFSLGPVNLKVKELDNQQFFLQLLEKNATSVLTKTELMVARHYAQGKSRAEIAKAHNRSCNTIKVHINNVYKKLSVSSKVELAGLIGDGLY
jgi:DNA-binding CsgD family transcriptional regulator